MFPLSRRQFLKGSALLAASAATAGLQPITDAPVEAQAPQGAGERINIAVIGVNGRGGNHVSSLANNFNCRVTHICDVDTNVVRGAVNTVTQRQGAAPTVVQDLRRIMDNRDIHAVTIATPNHWHSLAAIWAMQAGKDVYCEKPISHNVWEGRRVVDIARSTNKICQAGTQSRSSALKQAMDWLKGGGLGQVLVARGLCYKPRGTIGTNNNGTIPATCDYDLWCGPAPVQRPLGRNRLHYDWHWHWNYGNGDIGNQGIHEMDKARWGLGVNELCRAVQSVGCRLGYTDNGQTPNTQVTWFDYGDKQLIFEVRGLATPALRRASVGNIYYCTNGYMVVPNYQTANAFDLDGNQVRTFNGSQNHYQNWINAVRSRRVQDLNADILEGHLSSALCHLANVSYRAGAAQPFEPRQNVFVNSPNAQNTMVLMEEHLAANGVNLANSQLQIGRRLTVHPTNENFPQENAQINAMLTREYRPGFVVPPRA